MTATTSEYTVDEVELPRIRKLDRSAPMRWVSQGLDDLKTSGLNSIILILLRLAWSRLAAMVLVFFFDHSTLVSGGWGALYDDANFLPFIGTFIFFRGGAGGIHIQYQRVHHPTPLI